VIVLTLSSLAQQAPSSNPAVQLPDAPTPAAPPQHASFKHGLAAAAKTIGDDEWRLIKAPFETQRFGFDNGTPMRNTTLYWNAGVMTGTGVLIANDESVAQQVSPSWHQASTNIANACTYGAAATAGGVYLTGLFTHDAHAQRTGVLAAEASVDSFLLYGSMKLIFNRQRPYQSVDGKFFAGNFSSGSFPSGHSAFTWTLASVIAHEYPKWPVQLAMYGLATAVSTTRVTAGQHFPSDVFVGSTLGFLVGRYVANKDKQTLAHPAHSGNKVTRLPNAILEHISFQ
jgi:PAP2 superfamily